MYIIIIILCQYPLDALYMYIIIILCQYPLDWERKLQSFNIQYPLLLLGISTLLHYLKVLLVMLSHVYMQK